MGFAVPVIEARSKEVASEKDGMVFVYSVETMDPTVNVEEVNREAKKASQLYEEIAKESGLSTEEILGLIYSRVESFPSKEINIEQDIDGKVLAVSTPHGRMFYHKELDALVYAIEYQRGDVKEPIFIQVDPNDKNLTFVFRREMLEDLGSPVSAEKHYVVSLNREDASSAIPTFVEAVEKAEKLREIAQLYLAKRPLSEEEQSVFWENLSGYVNLEKSEREKNISFENQVRNFLNEELKTSEIGAELDVAQETLLVRDESGAPQANAYIISLVDKTGRVEDVEVVIASTETTLHVGQAVGGSATQVKAWLKDSHTDDRIAGEFTRDPDIDPNSLKKEDRNNELDW